MTPEEREKAWKELALHLGGILMSARQEATTEWMDYVAREINEANKRVAEIEGEMYDITHPLKAKFGELTAREYF